MKASLIFVTVFFLCSCGGGGGSADSNSVPEDGNTTATMDDLVVSRDFDFIGGEAFTITVMDGGSSLERRYLNICSEFIEDNGAYIINYDSCLLRTSLQGQYNDFEIKISSNQQALIAQFWLLNDDARPVNYFWSQAADDNDWQIIID